VKVLQKKFAQLGVENLEERLVPAGLDLYWNPAPNLLSANWGDAANWHVGGANGAVSTRAPGAEDAAFFTGANNADCTITWFANPNAAVSVQELALQPGSASALYLSGHNLTIGGADVVGGFTFQGGGIDFTDYGRGHGSLNLINTAGSWRGDGVNMTGGGGEFYVGPGSALTLGAGERGLQAHLQVGTDAQGALLGLVKVTDGGVVLDLGKTGDVDVGGEGEVRFLQTDSTPVVFRADAANVNTVFVKGTWDVGPGANVQVGLDVNMPVADATVSVKAAANFWCQRSFYEDAGHLYQEINSYFTVGTEGVGRFLMSGGEFDVEGLAGSDPSLAQGGDAYTTGNFVFEGGKVELSYGTPTAGITLHNATGGSLTFEADCTLVLHVRGWEEGGLNLGDQIWCDDASLAGTLRLVKESPVLTNTEIPLVVNQYGDGHVSGGFGTYYQGSSGTQALDETYARWGDPERDWPHAFSLVKWQF